MWLRLTARGRAGHGSVPNDENAIVRLAEAIARIAAHKWPREYIPSVRTLLDGCSQLTGTSWSDEDLEGLLAHLGGAQGSSGGRFRTRATSPCWMPGTSTTSSRSTPPRTSTAGTSPATRRRCWRRSATWRGSTSTSRSSIGTSPWTRPSRGSSSTRWSRRCAPRTPMPTCCPTACPAARTTRPCRSSGSRATGSPRSGSPPTSTSPPMFHGIDERVPVESLRFGARVLLRLLETC